MNKKMLFNYFFTFLAFLYSFSANSQNISKNYSEVVNFIHHLSTTYPSHTKLINLGASDSGEDILGLEIGSGPIHHLVVATHHGNEYGSTEVAKAFAESIAENPISGQKITVIPVLNISGFNKRQRRETANGTSLDPNRNYPTPCGTQGPFTLKSTKALADYIEKNHIIASATLHTYSPAVLYPWGISAKDPSTRYDQEFIRMGQDAVVESHYEVGNSKDLLYAADGTFEDYAFWKHGIWSMLFELGHSHYPSNSDILEMQIVNVPGLRRMFQNAPQERAEFHEFESVCEFDKNQKRRVDE